jgi:hypothetical protein
LRRNVRTGKRPLPTIAVRGSETTAIGKRLSAIPPR